MGGEGRDREFEAFVAGRSPALLRTAYLVTGDEGEAQRLLRDALATTYLTWRRIEDREGVEEYVRRVMLSDHVGRARTPLPQPVAPGRAPRDVQEQVWWALRELTPRERAVLVLASRDRLDDDEIARVLTSSRRAVQAAGAQAGRALREAVVLPPDATPLDLDAELQATLAAHADDVRPSASLVDGARDRAEHLKRHRRGRLLKGGGVAAGLVVVLGLAAFLLGVDPSSGAAPPTSPSPTPSFVPTHVAVPDGTVPDSALALGRETGALLASGTTIIDGATVVELPTEVLVDAESGVVAPFTIAALARAEGGYVVLLAPTSSGGADVGYPVEYVDPSGNVRRLGLSLLANALAISPDGLLVAFPEARSVGEPAVVAVRELSGQVMARREVDAVSIPVWLDREGVWVSPQVDPGSSPSYWNLVTNAVDPLNVPTTEVLQTAHGQQLILDDFVGDGCTHAYRAPSPRVLQEQWSECSVGTVRYSPTGELVAIVTMAPDTDVTVLTVRDSATGRAVAQRALLDRPVIDDLRWTADGQYVTATTPDSSEGEPSVLAFRVGADTGRLPVTRYPLTDDTVVVLGAELPLPPDPQ